MDMITPDENIRKTVADRLKGKWIFELIFIAVYPLAYISLWMVALRGIKQGDESIIVPAAFLNLILSMTILSLVMIFQRKGSDHAISLLKGAVNYFQCPITVAVMIICPNIIAAVITTAIVTTAYIWWRLPAFKLYLAMFKGEYIVFEASVISNEVKTNYRFNRNRLPGFALRIWDRYRYEIIGAWDNNTYHDVTRVARGVFGYDVYVENEKVGSMYPLMRISYHYCVRADRDNRIYEIQTDRRTFNKRLIGYRGTVVVPDSDEHGEDAIMI